MFHSFTRASTEDAIDRASERFERRLAEELSKFRVEMAHEFSALRKEIGEGHKEFHATLAASHTSLLRWSLIFWTGQFVALAALLSVLR